MSAEDDSSLGQVKIEGQYIYSGWFYVVITVRTKGEADSNKVEEQDAGAEISENDNFA
jgi:hypothetical protein